MRPIPWGWIARLVSTGAVIAVFNAEHPGLHGWQSWAAGFAVGFAWLLTVEYLRKGYRGAQREILSRRALRRDSARGRPLPPYLRGRR